MRISLPLKIALLAFIVVSIGIGTVSHLSFQNVARLLRQQSISDASDDVRRETSILADTLNKAREDVSFLAEAPSVLGLMRAVQGKGYDDHENMTSVLWIKRLNEMFVTILRQRKYYDKIRFIGVADQGREIARVDRHSGDVLVIAQAELQQKQHRPYFKVALNLAPGTPYFSETNLNYEYGKPTLPLMMTVRVGIPVFTESHDLFGIIIINIDFGSLARGMFSTAPQKSNFFITNSKGEYIYHKNQQKLFLFQPNRKNTRISYDFPDVNFQENGHPEEMSDSVIAGVPIAQTTQKEGIIFQHLHFDAQDKTRFYILGATISHSAINASSDAFGKQELILVMIVTLVLGFVILGATFIMTRPVRELTKCADRIARGETNVQFPNTSRDEVGALSVSLCKMYDRQQNTKNELQNLAENLESDIEQRTHQLALEVGERKRAEEKIRVSLKEKEVLLQEIHHRVKNNLQVVSSLLSLQAGAEKNKNIVEALNESERRVRVMARVHENLYRAGDLAHVNAKEYLNAIAKDAKMSHGESAMGISILEDIDDISMDVDRAIPIGQIVSELISNSFKHAFPNDHKGTVLLALKRRKNKKIELTVEDNGAGFAPDFVLENCDSLGLKLVASLALSLDGKIKVESDGGTKIGIKFEGGGGGRIL